MLQDWLVVIPARLGSTRLSEKPLQDLGGKPLIIRVVDNLALLSKKGARLLVATDSEKVIEVCHRFGVTAEITGAQHQSGTDRCWEIAQKTTHPFILNVQGDEPFIETADLIQLMTVMTAETCRAEIGTLVFPSTCPEAFCDPNIVKALPDRQSYALYFTRAAAPFDRDQKASFHWQHIGVYAYRRAGLEKFCNLAHGQLEMLEKLEQLRALEYGMTIKLVEASRKSLSIDTPEDLKKARGHFAQ